MIPKIGISSKVFGMDRWYKKAQKSEFNTIEINRVNTPIFFIPEYIKKIKAYLEGKDLSLHSATKFIFTENSQFTITELDILKSEILVANELGAKEIIFHLKHDKLTKNEENEFQKIIDFAFKHKIDLIYESNAKLNSEVALDNLKRFPRLKYNLDLGHLNFGLNQWNFDLDEFLKNIRERVVYVHAHNNDGKKDQHLSLSRGTLDWQHVLDLLNMEKIKKIIIEVHEPRYAEESYQDLKNYFQKC